MTIAAGFKCSDGILLASDTLYSGAHQRLYGRKLWILHADDPVVAFGGAAQSVAALTRARDEIERKIRTGDSLQRTLDMIDLVLKKVNDKFGRPDWPDVQALVVIRAGGQNRLFQNVGQHVALSPVDLPTVCVGSESLGDYFSQSLFREWMSLKWAKVIAAYLVWNCKKYASGHCGGDTHFIEVPASGPVVFMDDQIAIAQYEQHLAGIDNAMQVVFPDEQVSDATVSARLEAITHAIDSASRSVTVQLSGASATMFVGGLPTPSIALRSGQSPQKPEGE